ncbi:unnamed protein product [Tuber melanosporum]|uniref:(Perigord truffle) hypothetical protein n=1 Tax=Tuber melanosporum (strain Mel28) TaxID=656061 RepID=D5GB34_TUBMM|nr:uncharacterized protein GSTUM_00005431001 [Tuber melanosporum]CAZ81727.1 unnamed protein product [Tuber melanosporum]
MSRRSLSLLSSLLFVLLLFTPTILADSEQQFQELARDVPQDRLHAALHDYNGAKFKHVKLAKRQSNTTTTSSPPSTPPTTTALSVTPTSRPSSASPTTRPPTTTPEPATTAPSAAPKRGTTSLTSRLTRTVTGPDGVATFTDVTVVVATPTDEAAAAPEETSSSTAPPGSPGLQNVGLRVSGGDSAIVAVIAALGFFML